LSADDGFIEKAPANAPPAVDVVVPLIDKTTLILDVGRRAIAIWEAMDFAGDDLLDLFWLDFLLELVIMIQW
jgi:hypothetical protein